MTTPTQKLRALLHFGVTCPHYFPTFALNKDPPFYLVEYFSNVIQNLVEEEKLSDVSNIILKAYSDGYLAHPKMLMAALAACVQRSLKKKSVFNEQMREAAFKAAKIICSSPENFFLFLHVSRVKGRGFQKFIRDWYSSKDVKKLGEIVGKNKRLFNISHKEIIKRSHLKPNGPARAAIIKYVLFGIKAAKKEFEENAEANDVLNYLQTVEDFRRMKDEQQAARYIEMYHFTLDHVPPHLMKSKEVWIALIGNLPIPILLKNLQRMGNKGFLKPNSVFVNKVIDALNNETAIAESRIHPCHVYMELRNYECSSKILAAEKAKRKRNGGTMIKSKKGGRALSNPANPKIISALYDLFATTCKLFLSPTGLRYFVAIDLKSLQPTDLCHNCLCISPAQATVVTSLCLLHADRNVAIYINNGSEELTPLSLASEMTIQEGLKKLEEVRMHRMQLTAPIDWALKKKEEHDVFIMLRDSKSLNDNIGATLQKYREEMKLPNVKFIIVFLKWEKCIGSLQKYRGPGIFEIFGFDQHVPRLIEAFSRGAF